VTYHYLPSALLLLTIRRVFTSVQHESRLPPRIVAALWSFCRPVRFFPSVSAKNKRPFPDLDDADVRQPFQAADFPVNTPKLNTPRVWPSL